MTELISFTGDDEDASLCAPYGLQHSPLPSKSRGFVSSQARNLVRIRRAALPFKAYHEMKLVVTKTSSFTPPSKKPNRLSKLFKLIDWR